MNRHILTSFKVSVGIFAFAIIDSSALASTKGAPAKACLHPLTAKSPPAAKHKSSNSNKVNTVHAPSDPSAVCVGFCPSSYYVRANGAAGGKGEPYEMHVVASMSSSAPLITDDGKYRPGELKVRVAKTRKPVVLVLASWSPATWIITVEKGARLEKVFLAGDGKGRSRVESSLPVSRIKRLDHILGPPYWESRSIHEAGIEERLAPFRKAAGLTETSFQGANDRRTEFAVPFYKSHQVMVRREQEFLTKFTTQTIEIPSGAIFTQEQGKIHERDLRSGQVRSSIETPHHYSRLPGGYAVVREARQAYLAGDENVVNMVTGQRYAPPVGLPDLSHTHAIAYDSKRRRFVVTGKRGRADGALVLYPARVEKKWEVLTSAYRVDYGWITYDENRDVFFAMPDTFGTYAFDELLKLSPEMKLIEVIKLRRKVKHYPHARLYLQVIDGVVAFVENPTRDTPFKMPRAHVIDPQCGEVQEAWAEDFFQ